MCGSEWLIEIWIRTYSCTWISIHVFRLSIVRCLMEVALKGLKALIFRIPKTISITLLSSSWNPSTHLTYLINSPFNKSFVMNIFKTVLLINLQLPNYLSYALVFLQCRLIFKEIQRIAGSFLWLQQCYHPKMFLKNTFSYCIKIICNSFESFSRSV